MRGVFTSFDHTMLVDGRVKPGDTRERHIKYAEALRRHYPGGSLIVVVRVPESWSSQPVELSEGLTAYPVPSARWTFAIKAMLLLNRLAKREPIHFVSTQTPFDDGLVGLWLKRAFNVPLNVQMRSSFLDEPYWIQERPLLNRVLNCFGKWVARHADTIRVVSHGEKERLERRFSELQGKVICLHPLVNLQVFSDSVTEEELRRVHQELSERGLDNAQLLLFVGRLVVQKNLSVLLKAFALVGKRMPTATLVMGGDGPLNKELNRLAKRYSIEKQVVWLGNLSLRSLRGWYASARTTVLTSFQEGFGKVVAESYLMGTPVIATPFVSAKELIVEGQTGFIAADFADHAWIADRMRLSLIDPERARTMGQRGKEHIQRYLLPEPEYLERLIDVWRQTVYAASGERG